MTLSRYNEAPVVPSGGRRARRSGRLTLFVPTVVLLFAIGACGDDDADESSAEAVIAGTSWTLATVSIEEESVAAVAEATLAFDADGTSLSGSTGCNQFSGTYEQSGSDLTIALGPVTLAACTDPAATAQETAILAHLDEIASFSIDAQLVLEDSSGEALLTYDMGTTSLEGTSWTATGVNNGSGGLESSTVTETVTADFAADNVISGSSGCNTYTGTYSLSGTDGISITGVATTRMACEEPLMTLEGQYLAALESVATYSISGSTLTLRDAAGSMQVTYTLAS
jgi:heat shock protein HslJ